MLRGLIVFMMAMALILPAEAQEAKPNSEPTIDQPQTSVEDTVLTLTFDARLEPGSVPGPPPTVIPYRFLVSGLAPYDMNPLPPEAVRLPEVGRGWARQDGQSLIIFVAPDAASGTYTLTLELPDGRNAEASFQHLAPEGIASPLLAPTTTDSAGPASPTPSPQAPSAPLTNPIEYYDAPANVADVAQIKQGIELEKSYIRSRLDNIVRQPVTVVIKPMGGTSIYTDGNGSIFFSTDSTSWKSRSPDLGLELHHVKIAAHEYFHVWQADVGKSSRRNQPYLWLLEGAAEFAAYEALIDGGFVARRGACVDRPSFAQLLPLTALESRMQIDINLPYYPYMRLAVSELLRGGDLQNLATYFRAPTTDDPIERFRAAFKTTPDQFYARFETLRANAPERCSY
jgi:hypothetical protein